MRTTHIRVFAPASVSNLGCGFDVFGLAIDAPGDEVNVSWNNSGETVIRKIVGAEHLPTLASRNTAGVAVNALLSSLGERRGVDIILKKKMPLGSGLGSSAASAVAAVVAVNELLGRPYSRQQLVPFAMEGERVACGSAHADNVAPSLMGGIVLVRSLQPLDIITLPVPASLQVVVVHPHVEVLTRDSRAVLKKNIPLATAVQQWANTAALVSALYTKDFQALSRAVTDKVAEPYRAPLIPGFYEVKEAALSAGALACSISGSGPSVFALCLDRSRGVATAMRKAFRNVRVDSDAWVSAVNKRGAFRMR